MKFENRTPFDVRVSTDALSSEWLVMEVTALVPWTLDGRLLAETVKLRDKVLPDRPLHHLAPDRRHIREVTLCGRATFPRAVSSAHLELSVENEVLNAALSGTRTWMRSATGELVPSAPQAVQAIDLGWGNALGGTVKRGPGLIPYTNLPSPSFQESWSANPAGIGFYGRPEEAEGKPVPGVEHPDERCTSYGSLGRSWSFGGLPLGTSHSVSHLAAGPDATVQSSFPEDPSPLTRLSCTAPPWLRFNANEPLRRVACRIDGTSLFDFPVRAIPFACEVRAGARCLVKSSQLLWLEFDLDAQRASALYFAKLFCPYVRGQERSVTLVMHSAPDRTVSP